MTTPLLRKAVVRAYTAGTHKADVQLVGDLPTTLPGVRVATDIPAADVAVGRECTILFFDAHNPADAIVITIQGALPSGGGGGTTDHGALTGLGDDDHTQYALLAGRSGGQSFRGGLLTGEPLNLLDGLGTVRAIIQDTSPFIILGTGMGYDETGDTVIQGRLGVGRDAPDFNAYADVLIRGKGGAGDTRCAALLVYNGMAYAPTANKVWGIGGMAGSAVATSQVAGLNFGAYFGGTESNLGALTGIETFLFPRGGSTTVLSGAYGIRVLTPSGGASYNRPVLCKGIIIADQYPAAGLTTPTDVYGLQIADISGGTNRYLLELGPTVPYMRLVGGAAPGAGLSNLYLNVGGTLYQLRTRTIGGYTALTID